MMCHLIDRIFAIDLQEVSWRPEIILTNLFYTKIFFYIQSVRNVPLYITDIFHIIGAPSNALNLSSALRL